MADQAGTIEVQLSLLSGHESAAFREIQQTSKQVTEMMKMFKARDFIEAADRLAKVYEQIADSTLKMSELAKNMQGHAPIGAAGMGGTTARAAAASYIPQSQATGILDQYGQPVRKAHEQLAEAAKEDKIRRESRMSGMTDPERAAEHRRQRFAGGNTLPPLGQGDETDWHNRIPALNPEAAGINIPQFGQLTVQDLLQWGSRGLLGRAERHARGGDTASMHIAGGRAATAADWARSAGNVAAGYAIYRQARRAIGTPGLAYGGWMRNFDETMPMGYRRDSNAFSDILGVQTPFSAFGGQGGREMLDQWRLRWSAGINGQQAAAINDAANQAGFAGPLGTSVRTDLMAPAFRQFKVDPQNLIPFTQTLRTGTASIQDLNTVIMQMGEGARSARMDMNSYTQAIAQSGEAAQASGGRFLQGANFGQQFSASTGLGPQVGSNLLNNRVVQSYLAARTGLPPNLTGASSPLAQQRAIEQALMERVSAYTGTMPSHREPIRDASGAIIGYETTSGRDAAVGAAAQDLGINQEEALAILNRRGSQGTSNFMAASRDYLNRVTGGRSKESLQAQRDKIIQGMENRGDLNVYSHGSSRESVDLKYDEQTGRVLKKRGWPWGWEEDKDRTKQLRDELYATTRNKQRSGAPGTDLRELHEMARAAGVSQSDWENQVDKQQDVYARVQAAQKLVQQREIDVNTDPNAVKFTGPAAKFFEALVKSNPKMAGAADLSKAVIATSNSGPTPLTPTTSAGGPLFP